jgi:hypothetical protein
MERLISNVQSCDMVMPLLMSYTPATRIEEETNPVPFEYSDEKQIIMYDMRTVGTYSLKNSSTKKKGSSSTTTDYKNAVDDSKNA